MVEGLSRARATLSSSLFVVLLFMASQYRATGGASSTGALADDSGLLATAALRVDCSNGLSIVLSTLV